MQVQVINTKGAPPGTPLTYERDNPFKSQHCLTQVNILNHWHLVQQTVGESISGQPRGGGLVRDHAKKDVQVILE